ncbi:zinc finger protein 436-like isoform X3 [Achroia grisella]|uniref:zinc finger protein 436-like isoform X3 n=1 Tax=Achroia grisella TaxID=688607 RepID=UPI0027D29FE2|nr:zinc finger protein 436-like isoform X3 [Achroia grisella]
MVKMSEDSWKLEKDLCRCCHSEGAFKNLSETCPDDGLEVYSDMLQFALNINMSPVAGVLCFVTYTICEQCIDRLRDAVNFKRQVQQCEDRFRDMYDRDIIKVGDSNVKLKQESPELDAEVADKNTDFPHMDTDDSDDFPLNYEADNRSETDVKKEVISKSKSKKTKPKQTKSKKKTEQTKKNESGDAGKKGQKSKVADQYTIKDAGDGLNLYVCNTCSREFERRDLFRQHYLFVHLKERRTAHSCNRCGVKVAPSKRALHMEEVHGISRPTCNACGKKFAFQSQVTWHQKKTHMGEKKYECSICPLKFASSSHLKVHQLKHTAERPHKCEYCEKTFRWKNNLTRHIMIHMDVRRHVCKHCGEAFVQDTSLKYHMNRRHPETVRSEGI